MRGGGLYACGFALTFLYLEAGSILDDVKDIGRLFDGDVIGYFLAFIIDSFKNTIQAFMWPVNIVQINPPWGPIALGLAFWLFPIFLKKPIEHWLFDGEEPPPKKVKKNKSAKKKDPA